MHDVFHRVRIGGTAFEGVLLPSGPHLLARFDTRDVGDIPLGHVSVVRRLEDGTWAVCKHGDPNQVRIRLHGISESDVVTLVDEFGLVFEADDFHDGDVPFQTYLLDTRAGAGLLDVVARAPASVTPTQGNTFYLGNWHRLALARLLATPAGRPS